MSNLEELREKREQLRRSLNAVDDQIKRESPTEFIGKYFRGSLPDWDNEYQISTEYFYVYDQYEDKEIKDRTNVRCVSIFFRRYSGKYSCDTFRGTCELDNFHYDGCTLVYKEDWKEITKEEFEKAEKLSNIILDHCMMRSYYMLEKELDEVVGSFSIFDVEEIDEEEIKDKCKCLLGKYFKDIITDHTYIWDIIKHGIKDGQKVIELFHPREQRVDLDEGVLYLIGTHIYTTDENPSKCLELNFSYEMGIGIDSLCCLDPETEGTTHLRCSGVNGGLPWEWGFTEISEEEFKKAIPKELRH